MTAKSENNLIQKVIKHILCSYNVGDKLNKNLVAHQMGLTFRQLKYPFDTFIKYGYFESKRGKHGAIYIYTDKLKSDFEKNRSEVKKKTMKQAAIDKLMYNFCYGIKK